MHLFSNKYMTFFCYSQCYKKKLYSCKSVLLSFHFSSGFFLSSLFCCFIKTSLSIVVKTFKCLYTKKKKKENVHRQTDEEWEKERERKGTEGERVKLQCFFPPIYSYIFFSVTFIVYCRFFLHTHIQWSPIRFYVFYHSQSVFYSHNVYK